MQTTHEWFRGERQIACSFVLFEVVSFVNNEQWYRHRAEMSNYMPTMIAFKRKRTGWKRTVENILVWLLIILFIGGELVFVMFSTMQWGWNPVIVLIVLIVLDWKPVDWLHKFVYDDDSGLHNLEGYDPETGTVRGLEGFDTSKFWYKEPPSKRRK